MIAINKLPRKTLDYVWCFSETKKKIFLDMLMQCKGGGCLHSESQKTSQYSFWELDIGPDAHYVLLLKAICSYTWIVHWHVVCVNATSTL